MINYERVLLFGILDYLLRRFRFQVWKYTRKTIKYIMP
jgi:hypothetical protein